MRGLSASAGVARPGGALAWLVALALVAACAPTAGPAPAEGPGAAGASPTETGPQVATEALPAGVAAAAARSLRVERSFRRVVIDAGHGGDDLGARGVSGSVEKSITLEIARATALALSERGFEVVQSRISDEALLLPRRTGMANASGAGLFVSIHANSAPSKDARGIETYYMDLASDEAAMRLAERENRALLALANDRPADDLAVLIAELRAGATARQSRELADTVHADLVASLSAFYGKDKIRDRGVRTAPFWVLVDSEIPAVLVEVGYLTHEEEEERLRTRGFHLQVAESLADSLARFAARAERTATSGPGSPR